MEEENPTREPVADTRSAKKRSAYRRIVLLLVAAALLPILYHYFSPYFGSALEEEPPYVTIGEHQQGTANKTFSIPVTVGDSESGLRRVVVSIEQGARTKEITYRNYDTLTHLDEFVLEIDPAEFNLKEGSAIIEIIAIDNSRNENRFSKTTPLYLDFTSPVIEPITVDHDVVRGGSGLVFYRVEDEHLGPHGVQIGQHKFRGYLASSFDERLQAAVGVYFSLFPVPLDYNPDTDKIELFAEDAVGNVASAPMSYRVRAFQQASHILPINLAFLDIKVSEHYFKYNQYVQRQDARLDDDISVAKSSDERVRRFGNITQDYRKVTEKRLLEILADSASEKYWNDRFSYYGFSVKRDWFGDIVSYEYERDILGSFLETGIELTASAETAVRAAAGGRVLFAGDLGTYGMSVVIDHGFGLATLYSNLSFIACHSGTTIESGDQVGKQGTTSFTSGQHLQFEVRLHGLPVRPNEWSSEDWYQSVISKKIENLIILLRK